MAFAWCHGAKKCRMVANLEDRAVACCLIVHASACLRQAIMNSSRAWWLMSQARVAALEAEAAQLRAARQQLEARVEEEAAARRRADDGRARAEAERARLQRGRDQLAMVLRVCA